MLRIKKKPPVNMAAYTFNEIEIRFRTQKVVHLGQAIAEVL